jgi:hypothetical protein
MELHERQQFDFFFNAAIERFVDRIEQRCGGPVPALARLRESPEAEGVWLSEFVQALFADFLYDNAAGACFILQALARRPSPVLDVQTSGSIDATLQSMARAAFGTVLAAKTEEALEQRLAFQVTD